jgi:hypothetical protein
VEGGTCQKRFEPYKLVKIAGNIGVSKIWMEEIPHCIHDIVVLEQIALVF